MSAYGIEYLDDAMRNLGEMTDYAVNACGMDLEDFWKLFLTTGYAEKFGEGVPRVVSGNVDVGEWVEVEPFNALFGGL